MQRLDSTELKRDSSKFVNLASRKIANMEASNPSLVRGFIPTWTKPIWIYLYPLAACFLSEVLERRVIVSKGLVN